MIAMMVTIEGIAASMYSAIIDLSDREAASGLALLLINSMF